MNAGLFFVAAALMVVMAVGVAAEAPETAAADKRFSIAVEIPAEQFIKFQTIFFKRLSQYLFIGSAKIECRTYRF